MDKKKVVFYTIVALGMLSMAVVLFLSTENRPYDTDGLTQMPATVIAQDLEQEPRYNPVNDLIGGLCALMLVGYLFWACYRKFLMDSWTESAAREDSLYDLSLETGQTEYDLFNKSAEDWAVSENSIDRDFRKYMATQDTPYYVKDFVRKNDASIDESLIVKKEAAPTSWVDWAKALLVFPGSILVLILMAAFLA